MSIKGTLETFNLCELLQMLAFNQKEGTLVLESDQGVRTVFLDSGRLGFLERDPGMAVSTLRLARRHEVTDEERLGAAAQQHEESQRHVGAVLEAMGIVDAEQAHELLREATLEQLFECQLTAVAGFEFVEGKALNADGSDGRAILPLHSVESLLLDLARMIDHWNTASAIVHGAGEIYEGTGIGVDLSEQEEIDADLADDVVPLIDGYRSIEAIARTCHATVYQVMQIVAALVDGGGVREVPTEDLQLRAEDLLASAEAERALPLLQRCIERGDAAVAVRLRLADALEACDRGAEAATELDTFAALCDEDDHTSTVFEALLRALSLREGDPATAARVCDYYLRRRPWLQEYRSGAVRALRDLISSCATTGRPIDAALRLKGFIDCGDAPIEDTRLLAELYEEAGERPSAAKVLYERAEHFLVEQRVPQAREALRRALELDPGHANARRRLMELDGMRRRRGHRVRIALILFALAGVASAAGVAWFTYRGTASTEIHETQSAAQGIVDDAELQARARIHEFVAKVSTAAAGTARDDSLKDALAETRSDVDGIVAGTVEALGAYGSAIDAGQAAGQVATHRDHLERLHQRTQLLPQQIEAELERVRDQARSALGDALTKHKDGEFRDARRLLLTAWSLGFEEPSIRATALRTLGMVDEYIADFEKLHARMTAQIEQDKLETAFTMGMEGIRRLLDSDLTRGLPFPVRVTSTPEGARVWLGAEDTGLRTPCVLTYSPFAEDLRLGLRMPGRRPAETLLPGFPQMRRDPESLADWSPSFSASLTPGARWTLADPTERFHALWSGGTMPLVAGDRGHLIYAVGPRDGRLVPGDRLDPTRDGVRKAGRASTGLEWRITGHRTLSVRTPRGQTWEYVCIGRLEQAPTLSSGHMVVVDELGYVYAFDADTGEKRWMVEINVAPTQGPLPSPLGLLLGTKTGAVYAVAAESGKWSALAPAAKGAAYALPFGDGALLLGGGTAGCRHVDAKGQVRTLGDASPLVDRHPWVGETGVAWMQADGIWWLGVDATAPVRIPALCAEPEYVTGDGEGQLFAPCKDGRLRAVRLASPDQALWSAPLGGRAQAPPVCCGGGLYVLVDGRLLGFDV